MASRKHSAEVSTIDLDAELDALNKQLAENPEGWADQAGDLLGYWNFEKSPIFCVPVSVRIFDGSADKTKPAVLYSVRLTKPCAIDLPKPKGSKEPAKLAIAQAGEMVGIWGKGGMRRLRDMCGQECKVFVNGTKDTGKPNPMFVFKVLADRVGTRVPVIEDARVESANAFTPFDTKPSEDKARRLNATVQNVSPQVTDEDDDEGEDDEDEGL